MARRYSDLLCPIWKTLNWRPDMNKTMQMEPIKIVTGPGGQLMSLMYIVLSGAVIVFDRMLGVLGINVAICICFAGIIALDFLTGMWKSYRIGVPITSEIGQEGFLKKIVMLIAGLVLALFFKVAGANTAIVVNTIMVCMGLIEVYSTIGNLISVLKKKEIKEQDALTYALTQIRETLWKWVKFITRKGGPKDGDS